MEFNLKRKTREELIELFVTLDQRCRKLYNKNVELEAEIVRLQKAEHNSEYKQSCENCFYKPISRDHS